MIIDLKVKIEEVRLTEEALNKLRIEKDKYNECLKIEVVSLRKKLQETNMNSSSKILNRIISCQRSTNGYQYADWISQARKKSGFNNSNKNL